MDDATRGEEGRKEAGGAAAHVAPAAAAVRGAGIARPPDRAAHAHGPEVHLLNKCRGKLATEGQENFAPELQLNISGLDHALEEGEGGGGGSGGLRGREAPSSDGRQASQSPPPPSAPSVPPPRPAALVAGRDHPVIHRLRDVVPLRLHADVRAVRPLRGGQLRQEVVGGVRGDEGHAPVAPLQLQVRQQRHRHRVQAVRERQAAVGRLREPRRGREVEVLGPGVFVRGHFAGGRGPGEERGDGQGLRAGLVEVHEPAVQQQPGARVVGGVERDPELRLGREAVHRVDEGVVPRALRDAGARAALAVEDDVLRGGHGALGAVRQQRVDLRRVPDCVPAVGVPVVRLGRNLDAVQGRAVQQAVGVLPAALRRTFKAKRERRCSGEGGDDRQRR